MNNTVWQRINTMSQQLFPRTVLSESQGEIQCLTYVEKSWRQVDFSERPNNRLFGQEILLIPETATLFRMRSFPCNQIGEADLIEAIELDIDTWSPFGSGGDYYHWPARVDDQWDVAIWVWDINEANQVKERYHILPTHIMPAMAFNIAAANSSVLPCVCIFAQEGSEDIDESAWQFYTFLNKAGIPQYISKVQSNTEAQRFWSALDELERESPVVTIDSVDPIWAPVSAEGDVVKEALELQRGLVRTKVLRHARQPGIIDWADAITWVKPLGAVLTIYIFWLLGSSLILLQQSKQISQQVDLARSSAINVLEQRDNVTRIHDQLTRLHALRSGQSRLEQFMVVLSESLPEDAWLDAIQYDSDDGGWVDIEGKSKHSARLAAVLEALPEIEHAMFLNDIRVDKRTGLEPFKIRLKLASIDTQEEEGV